MIEWFFLPLASIWFWASKNFVGRYCLGKQKLSSDLGWEDPYLQIILNIVIYFGDFLCSMKMEALVWRSPVLGENSQASLREATRTDQIMTAFNFFVHMMTASNLKPNLSLNPKNCVTKISWLWLRFTQLLSDCWTCKDTNGWLLGSMCGQPEPESVQ